MKRWWMMGMLMLCMIVTAACGGDSGKNVFTDEKEMARIMAELQEKSELKGQELMVFQDVVAAHGKDYGGNFVVINLLKPGTKEDVDRYTYRGSSWGSAEPLQITGDGDMTDNLTPWNDFHWDALPVMYKAMQARLKEEGVTDSIKKGPNMIWRFWHGKVTPMMDIETDRAAYDAEFTMDGQMTAFKKK